MVAQVRIVSSLADVDAAVQDLQITGTDQVGLVQFQLHERAPLREVAMIDTKTRPGRQGFRFLNPELLRCKTSAMIKLESYFNTMLDASLKRIDQELLGVDASIAKLRVLMLYKDDQMPHNGPPLEQRNRGIQHVIYPHPPFPEFPSYEYGTTLKERVPYQPPYDTQQERDAAAARDRRAQRALWHTKLRILEVRQSILKKTRSEMLFKMCAEFNRIMEEPSDLGAGYAEFSPLA